jgi:hypothetical protein
MIILWILLIITLLFLVLLFPSLYEKYRYKKNTHKRTSNFIEMSLEGKKCIDCNRIKNLLGPFPGFLITDAHVPGLSFNYNNGGYSTEPVYFYVCRTCLRWRAFLRAIGGFFILPFGLLLLVLLINL